MYVNSSSGISECLRISRGDIQYRGDIGPGLQSTIAAALDHRTVGDRIGEGNAQFNQIRAAAFQRSHQCGRVRRAMGRPR